MRSVRAPISVGALFVALAAVWVVAPTLLFASPAGIIRFRPLRPALQRGSYLANVEPAARALLLQMQRAEPRLDLSGRQTTVLYRGDGRTIVSTQIVYRDSRGDYRCEFQTPARLAGDVIVSSGATSWHYMPSKNQMKVARSHPRHLLTSIGPAFKALRDGQAQARLVGDDTVAGIAVGVVEITGTGSTPTGSIKIWIDPSTGAQLKTAIYDASGAPQSLSFFTEVSYDPTFPPNAFSAPAVPPGTRIVIARPPLLLKRVPSDAEAGFHVLQPADLPAGFRFESASVFNAAGHKAVALRYDSALTLLSVFEVPAPNSGRAPGVFLSPRAGTVVTTRNGMRLAAMGTLDEQELEQVLRSMR